MNVNAGKYSYEWIDKWAKIPDTESARMGWAHHAMAVTAAGDIVGFHQGDPQVLIFDSEGNLKQSWDSGLSTAHGMFIANDGNTEHLWLADNETEQVIKTTLNGQRLMEIQRPDLKVYEEGKYAPTSVVVNQESHGGNGDVWVADGYGSSYIHRYDKDGGYILSINGSDSDYGPFNCPHGVWIDTRKTDHELYVADRHNGCIQVYDLDGIFKRSFGHELGKSWLHSPSAFASYRNLLFVVELRGSRVSILDEEDNLVGYLGENSGAFALIDGWPNVDKKDIYEGKFNSPHGIAVDSEGNLYVAEWLIGGRIVKLKLKADL